MQLWSTDVHLANCTGILDGFHLIQVKMHWCVLTPNKKGEETPTFPYFTFSLLPKGIADNPIFLYYSPFVCHQFHRLGRAFYHQVGFGGGGVQYFLFTKIIICITEYLYSYLIQSPILPLRLLVPAGYPKCSPVILDKLLDEQRSEHTF